MHYALHIFPNLSRFLFFKVAGSTILHRWFILLAHIFINGDFNFNKIQNLAAVLMCVRNQLPVLNEVSFQSKINKAKMIVFIDLHKQKGDYQLDWLDPKPITQDMQE